MYVQCIYKAKHIPSITGILLQLVLHHKLDKLPGRMVPLILVLRHTLQCFLPP